MNNTITFGLPTYPRGQYVLFRIVQVLSCRLYTVPQWLLRWLADIYEEAQLSFLDLAQFRYSYIKVFIPLNHSIWRGGCG